MRLNIFIFFIFILIESGGIAQKNKENNKNTEIALEKFIIDNVKYPKQLLAKKSSATFLFNIFINKNGLVDSILPQFSDSEKICDEIFNIFLQSKTKWNYSQKNIVLTIPIYFLYDEDLEFYHFNKSNFLYQRKLKKPLKTIIIPPIIIYSGRRQ